MFLVQNMVTKKHKKIRAPGTATPPFLGLITKFYALRFEGIVLLDVLRIFSTLFAEQKDVSNKSIFGLCWEEQIISAAPVKVVKHFSTWQRRE